MAFWRSVATIHSPFIGGVGTNTWHCRSSEPPASATDELTATTGDIRSFYDAINDMFAVDTVIASDGVWTEVGVEDPTVVDVPGFSVPVAGGGDPLPAATCLVAGWRAPSGGRSGRGRSFINPLDVSCLQTNGTPTDARVGQLATAGTALIAATNGADHAPLVVWSVLDNVGRDITTVVVRDVFASLRSRRD